MRAEENRGRYDRSRLRYPSDLSDEEWAESLHGPRGQEYAEFKSKVVKRVL
jgi:hypothetical protein